MSADEDAAPEPGWWSRTVVHHFGVVMFVTFTLALALSAAALAIETELMWSGTDPSDILTRRQFAYHALEERGDELFYQPGEALYELGFDDDSDGADAPRECEEHPDEHAEVYRTHLIFRSKSGDALSEKALDEIAAFEREVRAGYCFTHFASKTVSVDPSCGVLNVSAAQYHSPLVLAHDDGDGCACAAHGAWRAAPCALADDAYSGWLLEPEVARAQLVAAARELCANGTRVHEAMRAAAAAGDFATLEGFSPCERALGDWRAQLFPIAPPMACAPEPRTRFVRSTVAMGGWWGEAGGLAGVASAEALEDAGCDGFAWIDELFAAKANLEGDGDKSEVEVFWVTGDVILYYLYHRDLPFVGISFVVVASLLWANTRSLFVTLCGMFEIVVSFPLGLFVWYYNYYCYYCSYCYKTNPD